MRRALVCEILDGLPPDDPAARGSRRDLRRINRLMAQAPIAASLLRAHGTARPRHVADLGCGDGAAALAVLRRLGPAEAGATLTLLDARPAVEPATRAALEGLGWRVEVVAADVFDWLDAPGPRADVTLANLFVHHFEGAALARLLAGIAARTTLLVATEPYRAGYAHLAARGVALIGANAVTRHDAPASVRAGFAGDEIGRLWPGAVRFEGRRGPFTHAFAGEGTA